MNDAAAMATLIDALRPWLGKLVFVGGWAHRLHRLHPSADVPAYAAVVTRDADIAIADPGALQGDLAAALTHAGFLMNLSGDFVPPVSHFSLGEEDAGFYVEFLTPLRGGGSRRDGREDATVAAAGVTAQKLRHLDVLLIAPWVIGLSPASVIAPRESAQILVTNPVSLIVQKLLIHHDRRDSKRAQDLLYIHDTIELFEPALPQLQVLWRDQVGSALTSNQRDLAQERADRLFRGITDDLREAALVPADRRLDPGEMRLRCSLGLAQLFADDVDRG